jgi:hypothetical protein
MSRIDTSSRSTSSAEALIEKIVRRELEQANRIPAPKKARDQKLRPLLAVLFVVVTGLTVWNTITLSRTPTGLTNEEGVAYLRVMSATAAIEDYAAQRGRLPSALSQLEVDPTGLVYETDGQTYSLSVAVEGESARFERGDVYAVLNEGLEALPDGRHP